MYVNRGIAAFMVFVAIGHLLRLLPGMDSTAAAGSVLALVPGLLVVTLTLSYAYLYLKSGLVLAGTKVGRHLTGYRDPPKD